MYFNREKLQILIDYVIDFERKVDYAKEYCNIDMNGFYEETLESIKAIFGEVIFEIVMSARDEDLDGYAFNVCFKGVDGLAHECKSVDAAWSAVVCGFELYRDDPEN